MEVPSTPRPWPALDPIFRNHLAFLATHRGELRMADGAVSLVGHAAFLSFFSPIGNDTPLPRHTATVWHYPWSGGEWPGRLTQVGFAAAERLSYMQLDSIRSRPLVGDETVERVDSQSAAVEFAEVQAHGFLTDEGAERDWWTDCFQRMALRNYRRPDQAFWLARADSRPAAVLLTVRSGNTTGIYAVATVPEHRGKGLSTALVKHALEQSSAEGSTQLVLQVMAGSYAHGLYRRLGFADRYSCQIWRR